MNGRSSCSRSFSSDQIVLRREQQRLCTHHRQILLEKNVAEQICFRRHFRADRSANCRFFSRSSLSHDDDQIVLLRKFLFAIEKILVVFFVRADEVVAVHVELQEARRCKKCTRRTARPAARQTSADDGRPPPPVCPAAAREKNLRSTPSCFRLRVHNFPMQRLNDSRFNDLFPPRHKPPCRSTAPR